MHLATKSVNSQVTTQLTDLNSPELFFGTLNLCLDQAERKQPNSHKHMKMTHSIPMAVLQDFSFSFPFFKLRKRVQSEGDQYMKPQQSVHSHVQL